jgi:hypothetical protein|tara:strand:+ start:376 stop:762 length:387 start_codon:yes stop_codon:yes gene_type:complete
MIDTPKKYTEKQDAFLEALMGEAKGNLREAMRIAGYSDSTKINEVVSPLKQEIVDRASTVLALNAPKAAFSMLGVLDDPTALGARNQINAAKEVLDRTGLVKKEQVEVINTGGAMFILPPKQVDDGME